MAGALRQEPPRGKRFWVRKGPLTAVGLLSVAAVAVLLAGGVEGKLPFFGGLQGVMGESQRQPAPAAAVFYDLPELLVNLNSADDSYLKLAIALELESADQRRELDRYLPRLVDSFQ
ncbi:MAG TPA: hypothetical protein VKN76_18255, partial [Kiloniellaceae bacterium]|nr:hypothetical protein [Kiloniellaceae bacterium]